MGGGGGNKLPKTKTYTSIIKWAFTNDGNPFLLPQTNFQPEINKPPDTISVKVHSISLYTSTKSLGIWKSQELSDKGHVIQLQGKHSKFESEMLRSQVNPYDALHLYQTVYVSQINYSLPSLS